MNDGQSKRILARLLANADKDVSAIDLHMAGSGTNNGFCASLSRRISDLRAMGHNVIVSRKGERTEAHMVSVDNKTTTGIDV